MNTYVFCILFCLISLTLLILGLLNKSQSTTAIIVGVTTILGWLITTKMTPYVAQLTAKAKITGYDINKKGSKAGEIPIPECVGLSGAVSFSLVAFILCLIISWPSISTSLGVSLEKHTATLLTVLGTILLGLVDDVLDLRWRHKLIFPFLIMIPTVAVYDGPTAVHLFYPINAIMGINELHIGWLFLLYIILLGIYCTNNINIYAGINGLEVGQSVIIGASCLLLYAVRIYKGYDCIGYAYGATLLSLFLGCGLSILKLNSYPSQIFIGDTYCYFAGIVIALSAMWSGTAISVQLFMIPQLINFLYSLPQLFGWVFCPRHRLTRYQLSTDLLHAIPTNMNLLNLSLRVIGPTNQGVLCTKLMVLQVLLSLPLIVYELIL